MAKRETRHFTLIPMDGNNANESVSDAGFPGRASFDAANQEEDDDNDDDDNPRASSLFRQSSLLLDQYLFFLAGMGSSMGYISSLSSLVYFQQYFGNDDFFVILNVAVYFPTVPISILQAIWDQEYDRYFATRTAFVFRAIVGYGLVLVGTIGMIVSMTTTTTTTTEWVLFSAAAQPNSSQQHSEKWAVIASALLQGTGGAILYGQLNQLASFVTAQTGDGDASRRRDTRREFIFGDNDNDASSLPSKFKATVSAGVQASALAVLALSWASRFGTMNGNRFSVFVWMVVAAISLCFLSMLCLLILRPRVRASMTHRDSSMRSSLHHQRSLSRQSEGESSSDLQQPLLPTLSIGSALSNQQSSRSSDILSVQNDDAPPNTETSLLSTPSQAQMSESAGILSTFTASRDQDGITSVELSFGELWIYSREYCLILALTLIPSFLVGSWFTRIETRWMELPQILFYVRIGMDFLGRLATLFQGEENEMAFDDDGRGNSERRQSMPCVVWTALGRVGIVVLFFLNSSQTALLGYYQDVIYIALVAMIAFLSGYLVTTCYQLAPQNLPVEAQSSNAAAKQASLLTVAFAFSAMGGLLFSFVLIAIGV